MTKRRVPATRTSSPPMHTRRFTRLTNAFSKKVDEPRPRSALYFISAPIDAGYGSRRHGSAFGSIIVQALEGWESEQ